MGNDKKKIFSIDFAISFILISGAVTSSVIATVVIAVPLLVPMTSIPYNIPPEVKEWGGIIIGFYFGAFVTFAANVWKTRWEEKNEVR
jgi:hypothetical protein